MVDDSVNIPRSSPTRKARILLNPPAAAYMCNGPAVSFTYLPLPPPHPLSLDLSRPGRGSDSEADGKKPDVRRDDMLARRTASSESRAPVPFNQFLPNRTNATAYVPAPRRRAHGEEGEQRR